MTLFTTILTYVDAHSRVGGKENGMGRPDGGAPPDPGTPKTGPFEAISPTVEIARANKRGECRKNHVFLHWNGIAHSACSQQIHFSAQIKGFDHPPGFDLVSMKFSCFFEYAFLITEKLKIWKRKDAVLVQEKKTAQDYIFQNPRLFL